MSHTACRVVPSFEIENSHMIDIPGKEFKAISMTLNLLQPLPLTVTLQLTILITHCS